MKAENVAVHMMWLQSTRQPLCATIFCVQSGHLFSPSESFDIHLLPREDIETNKIKQNYKDS